MARMKPWATTLPDAGWMNCGINARYMIAAWGFNRLVMLRDTNGRRCQAAVTWANRLIAR
ncbi:hypothetical protein ABIB56_000642 [Glaciihabitans sp. UYNi722]